MCYDFIKYVKHEAIQDIPELVKALQNQCRVIQIERNELAIAIFEALLKKDLGKGVLKQYLSEQWNDVVLNYEYNVNFPGELTLSRKT